MPRRILKSRIPRNRDKYSVEQTGLNFTLPTGDPVNGLFQQGVLIVPSSSTQGMRKVKHLTVNLAVQEVMMYSGHLSLSLKATILMPLSCRFCQWQSHVRT